MLLDANLLLYAVDSRSPQHGGAAACLQEVLTGDRRVAMPWQTIGAFALAIEHGLVLCSTDTDFGRFDQLRWRNPLRH